MKKVGVLLVVMTLSAGAGVAQAGFWEDLTPAERRAAGLDHLTPEQQVALNRLAERFLHPGAGPVSEEARQEVREQVRAEVKQELQAEEKKQAAARAGLPAEESHAVIRTRIVGEFHGWSGATIFRLANGQVWVQSDNTDSYWVKTTQEPEIEIRPSKLGGWKLYLLDKGIWVRVRRIK